jgi:hypothetical protein
MFFSLFGRMLAELYLLCSVLGDGFEMKSTNLTFD